MSRQVDLGQIVPNIQVGTTTTGSPSTPASVENVGTDLNPILNFTVPKGDVGPQGPQGIQGIQGDTGNGIASIAKTSTSGLVDTYTITFTNGQTTTFEVTNGANGDVVDVQVDGTSVVDDGVANIILADIKQELEDMYNLLPKVSGTGETITLDGTVAGKMLINLKGNTSQEGTPTPETPQDIHVVSGDNSIEVGNNVFDISAITPNSYIDNNGNIYSNSASNLSDYIEVKENDIILSYDYTSLVSTNTRAYCWFDSNKNFISGNLYSPVNKINKFSVINNAKYIRFTYDKNISNIKVSNQSASYPISLGDKELCKIGNYQDGIDKSSGKNLFDNSVEKKSAFPMTTIGSVVSYANSSASSSYVNCCYVEAGTTYTFSCKLNTPASTTHRDSVIVDNDNKVLESYKLWNNTTSNTYTPSHSGYLILCVDNNSTELMINEGSTALPYEPYGTRWYLKKEIGSKLLTTSDYNNILSSYSNLDYVAIFKPNESANKGNSNNIPIFYAKGLYAYITNFNSLDNLNKITSSGGYNYFYLGVTKGITTEQAQNIVNGSLLYYPLATPTYTEITDSTLISQLEALKKARSYTSQTNISQNNTDLPFIINATALREMT